jgi:hypothetical protein
VCHADSELHPLRGRALARSLRATPNDADWLRRTTAGRTAIEFLLYRFCTEPGCADGALPYADVTFDKRWAMYGTTYEGGANNSGVVFEMKHAGTAYSESVLHAFGGTDGSAPTLRLPSESTANSTARRRAAASSARERSSR